MKDFTRVFSLDGCSVHQAFRIYGRASVVYRKNRALLNEWKEGKAVQQ